MADAKDEVELRKSKSQVKAGLFSGLSDEEVEKYHEAFTVRSNCYPDDAHLVKLGLGQEQEWEDQFA